MKKVKEEKLRFQTRTEIIDNYMVGLEDEIMVFKYRYVYPDSFCLRVPSELIEYGEFDIKSVNFYSFPEYNFTYSEIDGCVLIKGELTPFYKNLKERIKKQNQESFEKLYTQASEASDYEFKRDSVIQEFIGTQLGI